MFPIWNFCEIKLWSTHSIYIQKNIVLGMCPFQTLYMNDFCHLGSMISCRRYVPCPATPSRSVEKNYQNNTGSVGAAQEKSVEMAGPRQHQVGISPNMFPIGQAHGRCSHWNEVRLSNFMCKNSVFLACRTH